MQYMYTWMLGFAMDSRIHVHVGTCIICYVCMYVNIYTCTCIYACTCTCVHEQAGKALTSSLCWASMHLVCCNYIIACNAVYIHVHVSTTDILARSRAVCTTLLALAAATGKISLQQLVQCTEGFCVRVLYLIWQSLPSSPDCQNSC